jgi:hypothetical protein
MNLLATRLARRRGRPASSARAITVRGTVLALLLFAAAGCGGSEPEPAPADFESELAAGARFVGMLAAPRPASAMTDEEVIAAGYLERLRLGLGSPFRLMEYALRDPRLAPGTRAPLVWALLDATRSGRGYELDPRALARIAGPSGDSATARMHLELIDGAVRGAQDPRSGELAVREAYRLATASRTVSPTAPALAASAAALARDRELARRDAGRLLAHAARGGKHPFALLVEWRRTRRFEVEAPPGAPRPPSLEAAAAVQALALVARVEAVRADGGAPAVRDALPRLRPAAARRLAKLARDHSYPTQSPVWIAVHRYEEHLRRAARGRRGERAVERLMERARTEETLAAEHAVMGAAAEPLREIVALVAAEAGVAMRAYAQEKVWYPGFPAPSTADLKREFALRGVEFDRDVPLSWRPYYRRMLGDALTDLEVALPSLDLRGAAFRFGSTGKEGVALAIHDPHGRTIHLPPESGAGAIAHEVGHDLDWQVAHARYGTRMSYGTEYAIRNRRGDPFATAVRRMPEPPEVPMRGGPELQRRYAQRPAEIFARTFDGYVAAALAERGRSNGYLTAAQDEFLGGHGLALLPGARADAAGPFMEMMTIASPLPDASRRGFLARWGAGRVPSGFEVASRIVQRAGAGPVPRVASRPAPGMLELLRAGAGVRADVAAVMAIRDSAVAEWSAAASANPLAARGPRGEAAVTRLADAAAGARVRGIVLARARALGLDAAPGWLNEVWLGAAERQFHTETQRGGERREERLF